MSSIQTLRGILVAGAAIAGVIGLFMGRYGVALYMALAVAVHGGFTVYLRRRTAAASTTSAPAAGPPADTLG
jgi:uncharacterized membrane protein